MIEGLKMDSANEEEGNMQVMQGCSSIIGLFLMVPMALFGITSILAFLHGYWFSGSASTFVFMVFVFLVYVFLGTK